MKRITAVILSVLSLPLLAQDASPTPFALKKPDFKIEPYAQLHGWAVHSIDRKAETNGRPGLDNVDSRTNFFFRRARVGFRGSPYKNLKYQLKLKIGPSEFKWQLPSAPQSHINPRDYAGWR